MFTELYREEKSRGRKETEVARRIKGGIKRRETDPASNQLPKCYLPSRTHTEIHRVLGRQEKGEGGDRGNLLEKTRVQRGREQSSQ